MLDLFIAENRDTLLERTRARVALRSSPRPTEVELVHGIPTFLVELEEVFRLAKHSEMLDLERLDSSAAKHGGDLLRMGLTIRQVVNDYGDVCQTLTELAIEQGATIPGKEFRTLNLCLDHAIATAVTEYARQRERDIASEGLERLGILAHEMRNSLNTAMLSFDAIKSGRVAVGGSTGLLHQRSLTGLRDLIDLSLADVRLEAGIAHSEMILVAELIEELELGPQLQAQRRGIPFTVTSVDRSVTIMGDRSIIAAAISNLLQNAFKFTRKHGRVSLTVTAPGDRVLFAIQDECGGLPPGRIEDLLRPFEQRGVDRSGIGLGLSICLKAAKANGGELHARDLPGMGCVFTLDLPRSPAARVARAPPQTEDQE